MMVERLYTLFKELFNIYNKMRDTYYRDDIDEQNNHKL